MKNGLHIMDGPSHDYTEFNSTAWDKLFEEKCVWTVPITHEEYLNAGIENIFLTPSRPMPPEWISDLKNKKVLALACGGGQQCPIFVKMGANVTVLDISKRQLESERNVAEREGYRISILQGDINKPLPFGDETFDIIFIPIAVNYIENVLGLWKECYRVCKRGGELLSGFTSPILYAFGENEDGDVFLKNEIPFSQLTEYQKDVTNYSDITVQFSHSFDTLIGGQSRAGFDVVDIYEDIHPSETTNFSSKMNKIAVEVSKNIPTYFATRAKKIKPVPTRSFAGLTIDWRICSCCSSDCKFCLAKPSRCMENGGMNKKECINCSKMDTTITLTKEQIQKIATDIANSGCRAVMITGGEPTEYEPLSMILETIHKENETLEIYLSTNGSQYLKKINEIEKHISKLSLPLDGFDKDSNKCNGRQNFDDVVNILNHYNDVHKDAKNLSIKVGTVLSKKTISTIDGESLSDAEICNRFKKCENL